MTRRATINSLYGQKAEHVIPSMIVGNHDRVRTGAVSAIGSSLKELTEGAQAAARLQEQIATGAVVLDLDPALVDASMVVDRLVADVDPGFDDLVESIRSNGQQVPILVRPKDDRYQIAYGRRRLKAVATLGFKVKAIVRPLTDNELVIAQGKENLDRRDLSYIEKALFAFHLETQGFDRGVIMAALSTDKSDLSRLISVARSIPEYIAQSIGPAIKAGRPRWTALSDKLQEPGSEPKAKTIIASVEFRTLNSDGRFALLFDSLTATPRTAPHTWITPNGEKAAKIEFRTDRTILCLDNVAVPAFGQFLVSKLDELYQKFKQENS